jgi:hypothetical protein
MNYFLKVLQTTSIFYELFLKDLIEFPTSLSVKVVRIKFLP